MKITKIDKNFYGITIFTIISFYSNKISSIMNRGYYPESSFNFLIIPLFLIIFLLGYIIILYGLVNLIIYIEVSIFILINYKINISYNLVQISYKYCKIINLSKKLHVNYMVFRC